MPLHVDELIFHRWDYLNQMVYTVEYHLRKRERIIHVSEQCWQLSSNPSGYPKCTDICEEKVTFMLTAWN